MKQIVVHTYLFRIARVFYFVLAVVSFLLVPAHLSASVFRSGDDVHISHLHLIEDDFYCFGQKLRMDGTIDGDLMFMGNECAIQGTITRSANLFGRFVDHSGRIEGSLRAFAQYVTIKGQIDGSVVACGQVVTLSPGSLVERDVNLYGAEINLEGVVNGKASMGGSKIHITGAIQGDVEIEAEHISILRPAVITGNLTYTSKKEATVDTTGVTILGETIWKPPEVKAEEEPDYLADITLWISNLLALFLFGIILVRLFRPYAEESFRQLKGRFSVSLAAGFLGVLMLIACIVILVIALFSVLIGRILISGDLAILGALLLIVSILLVPITSFVSVSGGIILYCGMVVMAFLVGFGIVRLVKARPASLSASSLFIGLVVLTFLCALPYVGIPLFILATIVGAGSIILGVRKCRREVAGDNGIGEPGRPSPEADQ